MSKYKLLVSSSHERLELLVNEQIDAGWMPLGGVAVAQSFEAIENERKGYTEYNTDTTFAQAMVPAPRVVVVP